MGSGTPSVVASLLPIYFHRSLSTFGVRYAFVALSVLTVSLHSNINFSIAKTYSSLGQDGTKTHHFNTRYKQSKSRQFCHWNLFFANHPWRHRYITLVWGHTRNASRIETTNHFSTLYSSSHRFQMISVLVLKDLSVPPLWGSGIQTRISLTHTARRCS